MNNEDILFENETNFTKEVLQDFSKFINLKYNKFKYWETIIFSFLFLILGIYGAMVQIIIYRARPTIISLVFILFFLQILVLMIKKPKGNIKVKEKNINYKFTEEYLFISTELATQKILYTNLNDIQNVCNTEKYIYIMINKKLGYIIDKNSFKNYNEKEFLNYIQDKFKEKYINFLDNKRKKLVTMKDIIICIVIFIMFLTMLCGVLTA